VVPPPSSIPFFAALAFTTSLPDAVAAFPLRDATLNMVHPVGSPFAMEVIGPRERVRMNGLKQAANRTAWVLANAAGGWMIAPTRLVRDGVAATRVTTIGLPITGSAMQRKFFAGLRAGQAPVPEAEPSLGT
jgi:hypothetical protein